MSKLKFSKGFRNVFNLSYQRYIDIAKAEAQAREAQIELALERVRARTMAMQKSDELREAVLVIYQQLQELDFGSQACNIIIIDKDTGHEQYWVTGFTQEIFPESYRVPCLNHHYQEDQFTAWRNGVKYAVFEYTGKEKKKFDKIFFTQTDFRNIPEQAKQFMIGLESIKLSTAFTTYGSLQVLGPEPLSEEKATILKRFAKVFEQTYTRFLDLQKAEAQVREAQIETGLERVRSKTMAMHKSEEVTGIAVSLNEELMKLGFEGGSTIFIIDKETGDTEQWTGFSEDKTLKSCYVPYFKHPYHDALLDAWKREEKFLVYTLTGEEKKIIDEHYFATGYKDFPESDIKWMREMRSVTFSHAFMKYGAIHWGPGHLTEEQLRILQRFSKVFEQSYTRFLDLQKAEAQTREARNEAALERVRSRSMAMHKSEDLHEVIKVVTEQLSELGLKFNVANFAKIDPDGSWNIWLSTPDQTYPALIHVPYLNHPLFNDIIELIAKNKDFYTGVYTREEANIFFHHFFENTIAKNTPEERKQFLYSSEGFARSIFLTKNIWFSVARYDATPFIDEENAIFKRFANVFEQAYTRFLDLQKAEAQAREAQIEASLERVRSRAMAMQNSDELRELIGTVFTELTKLDIVLTRCLIMIYDPRSNDSIWWMANSEAPTEPIGLRIQNHEHPPYTAYLKAWQEKKLNWVYVLEGAVKKDWDDFLFVETELSHLPDFVIAGMKAPERVYLNSSFNSFGNLTLASLEPLSNEHFDILLRFAKVFDLTYTRFNDLKQAEAQAKEAKIEAALERVRARSMGMQKSDELAEVVAVLYKQFEELDFGLYQVLVSIYDKKKNIIEWWSRGFEEIELPQCNIIPIIDHPFSNDLFEKWANGVEYYPHILEGELKKSWDEYLFTQTDLKNFPQEVKDTMRSFDKVFLSDVFMKYGSLQAAGPAPLPDEKANILKRFVKVLDHAYTRMKDLQNAEAQAREAQIELALERVRARTMAMQHSNELSETASLLFDQLKELGDKPERTFIGVINEQEHVIEIWATQHGGNKMDMILKATIEEPFVMKRMYNGWKEQRSSIVIDLQGEELESYFQFLKEMGAPVKREIFGERTIRKYSFLFKRNAGSYNNWATIIRSYPVV
jgi:hypothetical protein